MSDRSRTQDQGATRWSVPVRLRPAGIASSLGDNRGAESGVCPLRRAIRDSQEA